MGHAPVMVPNTSGPVGSRWKGASTREAKAVCRNCPVWAECLGYALERDEAFGIWGGLSPRERRHLKLQAVAA